MRICSRGLHSVTLRVSRVWSVRWKWTLPGAAWRSPSWWACLMRRSKRASSGSEARLSIAGTGIPRPVADQPGTGGCEEGRPRVRPADRAGHAHRRGCSGRTRHQGLCHCRRIGPGWRVRPVNGVLSMAITAAANGFSRMIVPLDNAKEAAVVQISRCSGSVPCLRAWSSVRPASARHDDHGCG